MAKKVTPGAPIYANGSEVNRPAYKGPMPEEINRANRDYWSDAPGRAEVRLTDAQQVIDNLHKRVQTLEPAAERDERRQEGTRKPRRPEITKWILQQLKRNPAAKSPDLWNSRPSWISDPSDYDPIGERAFAKRVTEARKMTLK